MRSDSEAGRCLSSSVDWVPKEGGLHNAAAHSIPVRSVLHQATVLCDVIVLYCMKKRYYYRDKKYKYVEDYEQVGSCAPGRREVRAPCLVSCPSGEHQARPLHKGCHLSGDHPWQH